MQGDLAAASSTRSTNRRASAARALSSSVLTLARLGLGVELLPLVDIEEEAGGARVVLEAVADELGQGDLALAQQVGAAR